ncbi:MAG TPA: septal ring lytic transglycosylase RlpA family protein [Steroidobacteraceae bacterium]|nr:septal ring lytic transglycosylase RlpA family protein [Steroidobacteraceae bacterium]
MLRAAERSAGPPGRALLAGAAAAALLAACAVSPRRLPPPAGGAAVPPGRVPANILAIPNAVPRVEPRSALGNPPFYDELGHRYYVLASAAGYVERGVASWYGPTFDEKRTAMGERYDMYAMTAAHKTLPLPCYVRVTNLANGLSVVVRVNDRGPFIANRLIDLSYTAAAKLDMLREGTALVEVRAIIPGGSPPLLLARRATASPAAPLYLQVGAFANPSNAERLLARLRANGFDDAFVLAHHGASRLFRVRIGPIATVAEYDSLSARLASLGIPQARLALD